MAVELALDPYVPLVGSLPAGADEQEALAWVQRQRGRLDEGLGFSFAIADLSTDRAPGQIGLWPSALPQGRASAGYALVPSARGAAPPSSHCAP